MSNIKNYVELPDDEFNNRAYTAGQPLVIRGQIKGDTLHIIRPLDFKDKWPTVKARGWLAVRHKAGPISEETWLRLVSQ